MVEVKGSTMAKKIKAPRQPTVRRSVTAPADHMAAWEDKMAADGYDEFSAWLGDILNKSLPKDVRDSLSARPGRGAKKKSENQDN
jgi:hypothetical protein